MFNNGKKAQTVTYFNNGQLDIKICSYQFLDRSITPRPSPETVPSNPLPNYRRPLDVPQGEGWLLPQAVPGASSSWEAGEARSSQEAGAGGKQRLQGGRSSQEAEAEMRQDEDGGRSRLEANH